MKIVLENLTKVFPSSKKKGKSVVAVNNFNFEIPNGTLMALLGPSGCGKSTTLNLLSGLQDATSGKIFFGDNDVTSTPPEKRGVGLVFQSYALYPHLTVKENIAFPLENLRGKDKLSKEEIFEKVLEVSRLVQIDELLDRKPTELSGGQMQRVAIARALVKKPKVLLLDEPLSNLDARLRLQTREEIRRIQRKTGITTVFVTHDQDEAMSISDLIAVMRDGVVQQIDKPQRVYDDPVNIFVAKFLGTPPINVFNARVEGEKLFIGESFVMNTCGVGNMEVDAAIRPEGFVISENGKFECSVDRVEVMGRDISVICAHNSCHTPSFRAIVSSQNEVVNDACVKFDLKREKVYLFDKTTGERIRFFEGE